MKTLMGGLVAAVSLGLGNAALALTAKPLVAATVSAKTGVFGGENSDYEFYRQIGCTMIFAYYPWATGRPLLITAPAPDTIQGDVEISDKSQLQDYSCIKVVNGSLTLDDGVVSELSLRSLEYVIGDVTIVYEQNTTTGMAERVDLPKLKRVDGNLLLHSPTSNSEFGINLDFELPNLATVGGDVIIDVEAFSSDVTGLPSLEEIQGDLLLSNGEQDGYSFGLLASLKRVVGNLEIQFGGAGQHDFFNSLETVGGNLMIHDGLLIQDGSGFGEMNFRSLKQVLGYIHLDKVDVVGTEPVKLFEQLSYAGGFGWQDGDYDVPFSIGGATVLVGGLTLVNNEWLTDLLEQFGHFYFTQTAPLTITGNKNLPECEALSWVARFVGHRGPVDISGNSACSAAL